MYWKQILLTGVVLSAVGMTPTVQAARHVSAGAGTTIVSTEPDRPAQVGAQTRSFRERVRDILVQSEQADTAADSRRPVSNVLHQWPVEYRDEGGTLLFSDSPEYVGSEGILYRDTVSGDARVLYYHLNNTAEPKKVAVVLENQYPGLNRVQITRGGSGAPSEDYLAVGRQGQIAYWSQPMEQVITLMPGGARLLQEQMNTTILQPGQLVYGAYDFTAEHPVKVSVLMLSAYGDPVTAVRQLPVLPKDEMRLRGTFPGMNRILTSLRVYDSDVDGGVYFPLADDRQDPYREGIDATDGSKVRNEGNYGIVYTISLPVKGKSPVQYYLSPLGGVYSGAMQVRHGEERSYVLPTPLDRPYFGDNTPAEPDLIERTRLAGIWRLTDQIERTDLGVYPADVPTCFEFTPPGASNLPVNIILMPVRS